MLTTNILTWPGKYYDFQTCNIAQLVSPSTYSSLHPRVKPEKPIYPFHNKNEEPQKDHVVAILKKKKQFINFWSENQRVIIHTTTYLLNLKG